MTRGKIKIFSVSNLRYVLNLLVCTKPLHTYSILGYSLFRLLKTKNSFDLRFLIFTIIRLETQLPTRKRRIKRRELKKRKSETKKRMG